MTIELLDISSSSVFYTINDIIAIVIFFLQDLRDLELKIQASDELWEQSEVYFNISNT